MRNKKTARTAIVPLHRELATGTLASILQQAGLDADEFRALLC
ncbi:type II toxin-antitoxin system HicA family toxin [Frankia sp. Cppng1_Ct_nod]|nr:type II toxin-antitoxin system HicA family toxin [Frankia sp. Cppng1_Ct_nod]